MIVLYYDVKYKLLTLMFTFSAEPNHPRRNPQKMQPIPQIPQPQKLQSLPALQFYLQASQPLHLQQLNHSLEQQVEQYIEQRNRIDQQYVKLYEQYNKLKRQYDDLKIKYKEGEQIFIQMETDNMRMYHQLEQLKAKREKEEKMRISLGNKKKQIPIVKINVPNPKQLSNNASSLSQQSQKQSIYRQLKAASEQLAHMRKMLESEKQKSEHSINILNKNVQQLVHQRQILRNQINVIKQQNKSLKDETLKFRSLGNLGTLNTTAMWNGTFGVGQGLPMQGGLSVRKAQQSQLQRVKSQLERLQKVHKTCDILLSSKQTQIQSLQLQLQKHSQFPPQHPPQSQSPFHRTQSNKKLKANSSFIFDKESAQKQAHTLRSSTKNLHSSSENYTQVLEQHLELSTKQMKSIEKYVKELVADFIARIDGLRNQLQWANKKNQHQKFQLERVYQLLRDKKIQLDHCYNDLRNVAQAHRTPVKEHNNQDEEHMKSILKGRRNLSA